MDPLESYRRYAQAWNEPEHAAELLAEAAQELALHPPRVDPVGREADGHQRMRSCCATSSARGSGPASASSHSMPGSDRNQVA